MVIHKIAKEKMQKKLLTLELAHITPHRVSKIQS